MALPRRIWIYWLQGEHAAPELVQRCIASWRRLNPGWDVVVLDQQSYRRYADPGIAEEDFNQLGIPMRSDLLRLALLERYGGVWVDATVLCVRPLDHFIHAYVAGSGWFAYARSRGERLVSSWFLAALPQHPVVRRWRRRLCDALALYASPVRHPARSRLVHKLLRELLRLHPRLTRLWLRPAVARQAGRYPYFLLHYSFADLLAVDAEVRELWRLTPQINNRGCKFLSRMALQPAPAAAVVADRLQQSFDLFKLSHKSQALRSVQQGSWLAAVDAYVAEGGGVEPGADGVPDR